MKASKEHKPQKSRVSTRLNSQANSGLSKSYTIGNYGIIQLERKIIGHRDALQTGLIGINLMPSGKLMELIPGNGRGYSEISSKIAGHTSIISGSAIDRRSPMTISKGMGFSPYGLLRSLMVGICGFIPKMPQISVKGKYHLENRAITDDIQANQLLVRVTPETQRKWEKYMGNEAVEGIYSFNPERGRIEEFDNGNSDSDNCTTLAIRKAIDICAQLLFDTTVPYIDRFNIDQLEIALEDIVRYIVTENNIHNTAKGTQGRALAAFDNLPFIGNPLYNNHDLDEDDGFGLFMPPESRW